MNLGLVFGWLLEGENSPKIALHETPVIFVGLVRHHNQDINVLIVVAPDLGGRPDSDAGDAFHGSKKL